MFITNLDEFLYIDLDNFLIKDIQHMFDYMDSNNLSAILWSDQQPMWTKNPFFDQFPEGTGKFQRGQEIQAG